MAHADDAKGEAFGADDTPLPHPRGNGGENPLRHGRGIAARGIAHGDTMAGTIAEVDMVSTNGRRANETHTATVKQRGIAAGAGAHNERIGVPYGSLINVGRLQIIDSSQRFNHPSDVRNMAIYNNSHGRIS